MLIHLKTFDGNNINDGSNYRAILINQRDTPNATPIFIEQTNEDSVDAGIYTVEVQTKVITIEVLNYATRDALVSQLKRWFKRGKRGDLVATFSDDDIDYQINGRVVNFVPEADHPLRWKIILQTGSSTWRSVDLQTDTWEVTGTSEDHDITVGGNDETRLIASLTATAAPGIGYFYQQLFRFPNMVDVPFGIRPWCISLNTAALVTAGKMLSSCNDLRVYNGETEIKRWISGPNTTTTKIWFNCDMAEGYSLTLLTGIDDVTDVPSLQFAVNATTSAIITKMPNSGIVYHGTEWFYYSGKNATACTLTITKRGVWNTTKQAHVATDVFAYIQNPIRIVYGKATATDPSLADANYDNEKPVFNLSSSTNTSWVWDDTTDFYIPNQSGRKGQWAPLPPRALDTYNGRASKVYHVEGDAESGDPAMGIKFGAYQSGALWKPDTGPISFLFYSSSRISGVSATGRKYRNTAHWMPKSGFQRSDNSSVWVDLWIEASPSAALAWENWSTHSSVSVANTSQFIRFSVVGVSSDAADSYALSEALTVTVDFVSANIPTGTLLGEVDHYPLDVTLSNDVSGDEVGILYPALYNKAFLMDGEAFEATFDGVRAHRSITLNDEGRASWLRLQPGVNTLTLSSNEDMGTVSVALSWYRRRL